MKRIVFFTPSLNIGGVERVFITYAEALIRLGYDVSYLVCKKESEYKIQLPENLKIISLGEKQLRYSMGSLYRFFRNYPVDVFILTSKMACSKAKIIISHHNYFNVEQSTFLSKLFLRLLYNSASSVLSVSDGITKMLLNQGVFAKKLVTIYNPVDLNSVLNLGDVDLKFDLPSRYLLFLGRLGEVKNLPFLIESFKLISREEPSLHLIIVGDGPLRTKLENKTTVLELTDKIHFMGALPNPFPVMKGAEAVLLPSFSEALPTIILESFAFNKTVVATPTNGALDLLDNGRLGYISNSFDNVEDFAAAIKKSLSNPISGELLNTAVTNFNIDSKIKELERLF